ncbi:integrase core domain-containing protein [Laribacter hongkongensis]|uniref:integrase core domain-containing protein n=2 Tax=Laribacter hongkongensis TaxID=168471 RepID=UPI0009D71C9D
MGGGSVRMGQACSSGHTFVAFNSLLIEPGKPDQSLHRIVQRALPGWGLNEYWLISLRHAQIVIAAWRREYNSERPKKALGDMIPEAFQPGWPEPVQA